MIDALRGGSDEVDELGAEMRRRVDASGSLQDRYGSDVIDFFGAFLVGKMQEARDAARRLSVTQRSAGNDDTVEPPLLLGLAGASDDDVPSIDEALDRVRAIPVRSHVVIAVERCLDALLAARDGRPTETAARLYAEALTDCGALATNSGRCSWRSTRSGSCPPTTRSPRRAWSTHARSPSRTAPWRSPRRSTGDWSAAATTAWANRFSRRAPCRTS